MSRAHNLAWAAGFFDGEGFVTIQRRTSKYKDKLYESLYLRIGINHVAIEPLLEFQKLFGGNIRERKTYGNRHRQFAWGLSCSKASNALTQLLPYLKNKTKVAELGIELHNTMDKSKTSDEVILYRACLKDKITSLNAED